MELKLIHIECGTFNGIANYVIGDKIIRFELGTPKFNDYGEFRLDADLELIDYDKKYEGNIPKDTNFNIQLDDDFSDWWLSDNKYDSDFIQDQICGGKDKDGNIFIYTLDNNWTNFDDWNLKKHNAYEHVVFNVLVSFLKWYNSNEYKYVNTGVLIYPNL